MKKTIFALLILSISMTTIGQTTKIRGTRSMEFISSLIGTSITKARSILATEGLVNTDTDKQKDEELKGDIYAFYPKDTEDKSEADLYLLLFKKDKVVLVCIEFEFDESTGKKDVLEMKKQLLSENFSQSDYELSETDNDFTRQKWVNETFWFKSNDAKNSAVILNENNESAIFALDESGSVLTFYKMNKD